MQVFAFLKRFFLSVPILFAILALLLTQNMLKAAQPQNNQMASITLGSNSGLPVPRFVSLKSNKVNVRVGPDQEKYKIAWIYQKAGLPVEVIAEYDQWRRIRDANGDQGWINGALLDGQRTAIIAPWSKQEQFFILRNVAKDDGRLIAQVEAGVIGRIRSCDGTWCEIDIKGYRGWLKQIDLWGVYPKEIIKK